MKKIIIIFLMLVFQMPCLAINDSDIWINLSELTLNSKLKKEYSAYEYTITNNSNKNIKIVNAQIENAVSVNAAQQKVIAEHPIGTTWAIAGPVGLFTIGLGWVAGAVATPIVACVSNSDKKKVSREVASYTNIINPCYIGAAESLTVKVLVPKSLEPTLTMNITPEGSSETITINH